MFHLCFLSASAISGYFITFAAVYYWEHMNIADLLKEKGLKKSAQRVAILQALQERRAPLAEEEIKREMGEMYDRVTFYRTMQVLEAAGIIHRIVVDNTTTEYALNNEREEHPAHVHFYCTLCHRLTCLPEVPLQAYALPEGYRQESCSVLIKGICPACSGRTVVGS